jgi:hypothetical protein
LDTFKAQLDLRQDTRASQVVTPTAMQRIGFRLEPDYIRRLSEDGALRNMSPGDYARSLVVAGLDGFQQGQLEAAQSSILSEIGLLRADITALSRRPADPRSVGSGEPTRAILKEVHGLASEIEQARTALEGLHRTFTDLTTAPLHAEVRQMRSDLVKALQVILLNLYPDKNESEVKAFLESVFATTGTPS